jgi:superfamily I DNA and/or RNA helicase
MMPSGMFYNSTLLAEAQNNTTSLTQWTYLTNPEIPVLFYPCGGEEMWIPDTAGWYNLHEIKITITLIQHLLKKRHTPGTEVEAREIAVITPFREHVIHARKALRLKGLGDVNVGTVENYQGGERRITILNCVRSTPRFLDWDTKKGRGIVNQKQRFNVAITRAKELLIIIGNPAILQVFPSGSPCLQGYSDRVLDGSILEGIFIVYTAE